MKFEAKQISLRNGKQIIIREARMEDAEALIHLIQACVATSEYLLLVPEETNLTLEQEEEWLEGRISDKNKILLVATTPDNQIIGNTEAIISSDRKTAHWAELGITIVQEWRGVGVGQALMQELVIWVKQQETVEFLTLEAFAENHRAIALYERIGFKTVANIAKAFKNPNGIYADKIIMTKSLTDSVNKNNKTKFEALTIKLKNGQNIIIREATTSDAEQTRSTIKEYAEESEFVPYTIGEFNPSLEDHQKWIQSFADSNNSLLLLAVTKSGEIIGNISLNANQRIMFSHTANIGIGILKQWRGIGIGVALIEAVITWAKEKSQLEILNLDTYSTNQVGSHIYKKLGFKEVGRQEQFVKISPTEYVDNVIMTLRIK